MWSIFRNIVEIFVRLQHFLSCHRTKQTQSVEHFVKISSWLLKLWAKTRVVIEVRHPVIWLNKRTFKLVLYIKIVCYSVFFHTLKFISFWNTMYKLTCKATATSSLVKAAKKFSWLCQKRRKVNSPKMQHLNRFRVFYFIPVHLITLNEWISKKQNSKYRLIS